MDVKQESSSDGKEIKKDTTSTAHQDKEKTKPQNVADSSLLSSDSEDEYECKLCDMVFSSYTNLKQHEKSRKHARKLKLQKDPPVVSDDNGEDDFLGELQTPFAVCEHCKKKFSGPENYKQHLKSKAHKQKKAESKILEKVKSKGELDVEGLKKILVDKAVIKDSPSSKAVDSDDDEVIVDENECYECQECEKVFTGLKPFSQHLVSKVHKKKVNQKKLLQKLKKNGGILEGLGGKDLSSLSESEGVLTCALCSVAFSGPESAILHLKSKGHTKVVEKHLRKLKKLENGASGSEVTESEGDEADAASKDGDWELCDANSKETQKNTEGKTTSV